MSPNPKRDDSFRRLSLCVVGAAALGALLLAPAAHSQPTVPGFDVETYASVSDPVSLSFAPNGDLYVGRDLLGSGGNSAEATRIQRVLAGGSVVEEFGGLIDDPDAVLFDAAGLIAPGANSVLVGSQVGATSGLISAIAPDESVSSVFGPTTAFVNPSDMVFDGSGRLLFTDFQNQQVKVSSGALPTTLFSISSNAVGIAYDPGNGRIYTSGSDSVIRAHLEDGTLVSAAFGDGGRALAVSSGALGFGSFLYSVDDATGELIRFDAAGNASIVGSGFTSVFDLAFGPGGALYVSEFDNDRILRIAPTTVPATGPRSLAVATLLLAAAGLAALRRARRVA